MKQFKAYKTIVEDTILRHKLKDHALKLGYRTNMESFDSLKPYLILQKDGLMVATNDSRMYISVNAEEILPSYFLSIEKRQILKATEFVLGRTLKENIWTLDIYSHYEEDEEFPHMCIYNNYTECIAYRGNEHLLNTTLSAEK